MDHDNNALINQLIVPYKKYLDLKFLHGPHFIRYVQQNCGLNILSYGPIGFSSSKIFIPNFFIAVGSSLAHMSLKKVQF